jgi:hypothetical protein
METDETKPYGWAKTSNPSGNVNIPSAILEVGAHTMTMQPYSGKIFTISNNENGNSTNMNMKVTANSSLVKLGLIVKINGIDSIVIGDNSVMFNRTSATVVVVAGTNDILNHAPVTFTLDIESEA